MRCSHDYLTAIALGSVEHAFLKYGFTVEAVEYAIEAAIASLEFWTRDFDDEDAEALVEKVINVGLT